MEVEKIYVKLDNGLSKVVKKGEGNVLFISSINHGSQKDLERVYEQQIKIV